MLLFFQGKTIKGIFINSFYVVCIILISKDRECTEKFPKPQVSVTYGY